jgi:hypothetical protein
MANVHSGKWSHWVNLEVYNPTHHLYGIVAHAVVSIVISGVPYLRDNDVVREEWRDRPSKQPSAAANSSQTLRSSNPLAKAIPEHQHCMLSRSSHLGLARTHPSTPSNYALVCPRVMHVVVFWPMCMHIDIFSKSALM